MTVADSGGLLLLMDMAGVGRKQRKMGGGEQAFRCLSHFTRTTIHKGEGRQEVKKRKKKKKIFKKKRDEEKTSKRVYDSDSLGDNLNAMSLPALEDISPTTDWFLKSDRSARNLLSFHQFHDIPVYNHHGKRPPPYRTAAKNKVVFTHDASSQPRRHATDKNIVVTSTLGSYCSQNI